MAIDNNDISKLMQNLQRANFYGSVHPIFEKGQITTVKMEITLKYEEEIKRLNRILAQ